MADIFDTVAASNKSAPVQSSTSSGDIFDQTAAKMGGASGSWSPANPLYAGKFIPAFTKSLYENAPFGKDIVNMMPNAEQIRQNMAATPSPSNLRSQIGAAIPQVAMGAAEMLPMAGAASAAGFGSMSSYLMGGAFQKGIQNYQQGVKPSFGDFVGNTAMNAVTAGAGTLGSTIANKALAPVGGIVSKMAPNIGTSLGQATANWLNPFQSNDQRPVNTLMAGAMGAAMPQIPLAGPRVVSPEQYDAELDKGAKIYRTVLNPGKGIVNKVEIKSDSDIGDSMKLAAQSALPIASGENSKGQMTLDNRPAIDKIDQITTPMYDMQNKILAKNPAKQFSIQDLADEGKGNIDNPNHPAFEKNASDAQAVKSKIQNEADAEILRHGENVDGQTLNMIKQGWWGKSYNPLEPNGNDGARALGFAAKNAIEQAYPDDAIADNNEKIGKYLQLKTILEKTHGQVVQGGKLGNQVAGGVGALAGVAAGHILPIPIVGEAIGGAVGYHAGESANKFLNDPARITGNWAKHISNFKVSNPEPVNISASANPVFMKNGMPYNKWSNNSTKAEMDAAGAGKLFAQSSVSQKPSEINPTLSKEAINMESEGAPPLKTPTLETPENQQTFPQSNLNPLANVQKGSANDPLGKKIATAALVGTLGMASVFNPINAQAKQVQNPDNLKLTANQYIMKNEGWKSMPYLDTNGHKTVGYGFKEGGMAWKYIPDAVKQGRRALTKQEGLEAFNKAYPFAVASAQKFAGNSWGTLSNNQQKALIDMSYQMGSLHFPKLRMALESGNFNTAAKEILNSKYAKRDAPNRALQNAILMQS